MANLDVGVGSVALDVFSEPPKRTGNIIKKKYKEKYRPLSGLCGDDMSCELTAYVNAGNIDGKPHMDLELLQRVAKANGVWKDSYSKLNPGQQRMTIGNCLRHKIERGEKVTVGKRTWDPEKED